MRRHPTNPLGYLAAFLIVIFIVFIICELSPVGPHYSAGLCYENVTLPTENWQTNEVYVVKILDIGKEKYHYIDCDTSGCFQSVELDRSKKFKWFEEEYSHPVKCPETK